MNGDRKCVVRAALRRHCSGVIKEGDGGGPSRAALSEAHSGAASRPLRTFFSDFFSSYGSFVAPLRHLRAFHLTGTESTDIPIVMLRCVSEWGYEDIEGSSQSSMSLS